MNFNGFKDYPDTSTPLSAEYLNAFLDALFPIGKIEIFLDSADHSNYMGFVWERTLLETSPIGYNPSSLDERFKSLGNKFGEKDHKLNIQELPTESFTVYIKDFLNQTGQDKTLAYHIAFKNDTVLYNYATGVSNVSSVAAGLPLSERGNKSHNNIHPVEVVAFWKRVE